MSALCLVLFIVAGPPLADDATFQKGRALYQQLEFEEALIRFQEVALVEDRDPAELATALLWSGLAYAQLGRFDRAEDSFERGVRANPDLELPAGVSPKIQKVFSTAAQRAQAALAKEAAAKMSEASADPPTTAPSSGDSKGGTAGGDDAEGASKAPPTHDPSVASSDTGPSTTDAIAPPVGETPAEGATPAQGKAGEAPTQNVDKASVTDTGGSSSSDAQPPETSDMGVSMAYWAGAATGGVIGGALAAASVGIFAASYLVFAQATAPGTPQVATVQGLTLANGLWFASIVVVVAGVGALGAGATSATLAVLLPE